LLNFQLRLRHSRRQIAFPVDDSCREAAAMTATEFRDKKTREIEAFRKAIKSAIRGFDSDVRAALHEVSIPVSLITQDQSGPFAARAEGGAFLMARRFVGYRT
jgi:hypothetical protein